MENLKFHLSPKHHNTPLPLEKLQFDLTEVGPPERDKTDRLLRDWNDVWVKRHSSASTEYIEKRTKRQKLPIQFVQVLTNFWYSHT